MPVITWKRALALGLTLLAFLCLGSGLWLDSWVVAGGGLAVLLLVVLLLAVAIYRRVGFGIHQAGEQRSLLARVAPEIGGLVHLTRQIDANMRSATIRDLRPLVLGAFRDVQDATLETSRRLDQLTRELSRIEQAIRSVDAKAVGLASSVDRGNHGLSDLAGHLNASREALDVRASELEQSVSTEVNNVLAAVDTRLTSLDGRIESLAQRLSVFEKNSQERLEAHAERVAREVVAPIGGMSDNIAGLLEAQSDRMESEVVRPLGVLVKEIGSTHLRFDILNDAIAMKRILKEFDLTAPAPLMSGWAIEPVALEHILHMVCRDRPSLIVECGSGVSTIWLAIVAKRYGGRVIALEHQRKYADQTRLDLTAHGLASIAEVRDAPLENMDVAGKSFKWYSAAAWDSLRDIDLLLVDGPPKATGPQARYPALPLLSSRLSAQACIVIDDVHRKEEREILSLWNEQLSGQLDEPVYMGQRTVSVRWRTGATSR